MHPRETAPQTEASEIRIDGRDWLAAVAGLCAVAVVALATLGVAYLLVTRHW